MKKSLNPARNLLSTTPAPGDWLRTRLAELGKSQRSLAAEIGYDPTQVNKWISGKERIPNKALVRVGSHLGKGDVEIAKNLLVINTIVEGLPSDACQATQCDPEVGFELAKTLAGKAEGTAAQLSTDEPDRLEHLQSHLSTAAEALVMASRCSSGSADLIGEDNVRNHLCFPSNVMMGELLTFAHRRPEAMGELDQQLMGNIRKTAKRAGTTLTEAYCQQHAYHLLARYGTSDDRGFVEHLVRTRHDVITRRTAHYGAIFAGSNSVAPERFIFELRRDRQLEQINLDFDLVHYGDKELGADKPTGGVSRTISNNLRHILSHQGAGTAEISYSKLISILDTFGLRQFESKRIRERIEGVLRRIGDKEVQRRTAMESEFLTRFGSISIFRPLTSVQLTFPDLL